MTERGRFFYTHFSVLSLQLNKTSIYFVEFQSCFNAAPLGGFFND